WFFGGFLSGLGRRLPLALRGRLALAFRRGRVFSGGLGRGLVRTFRGGLTLARAFGSSVRGGFARRGLSLAFGRGGRRVQHRSRRLQDSLGLGQIIGRPVARPVGPRVGQQWAVGQNCPPAQVGGDQ